MNEKFDNAAKKYFSDRIAPSPELKEATHERLIAFSRKREMRLSLIIIIYAILFFSAILSVLWIFTGSIQAVFVVGIYFVFSLAGGGILIFVCRNHQKSRGDTNVFFHN